MDWNDLRFVLAVARGGSVAQAARDLGCHQATVFRRLAAIESRLGDRLFERRPEGYVPTPTGSRVSETAERVEAEIADLSRAVSAREPRPRGIVRVTTTETMVGLLMPELARFRAEQPEIVVHLSAEDRFLDLSRADADVAVRPSRNPPPGLVGRRLADLAYAPYAAEDYLARTGTAGALADHDWIGLDDALSHLASARWIRESAPPERVRLRVNSLTAALAAAVGGLGVTALPCYLGDVQPRLVRLGGPIEACAGELWLLTHPGLRKVPRVRAFLDFAASAVSRRRPLLEGRRPARAGNG